MHGHLPLTLQCKISQLMLKGCYAQVWDLVVVGAGIAGSALAYSQGQVPRTVLQAFALLLLTKLICYTS